MTALTVAHILHSFGTGGMEKGVATLVSNSSEQMRHVIICLTQAGNSVRLLPKGTEIIELNKQPGNSIQFYRQLSKVLRQLKPDVVHTRNWGGTDGIIAARLAGIRSVVHSEHGFGPDNPYGTISRRIWIHRLLSPLVKEYIVLSADLREWCTEQVKVKKTVTQIINGVDTAQYTPGDGLVMRKTLDISPDAFVVGIVASLNTIKDHPTLIQAFKIVQAQAKNSILLIAGDGPERSKLKKMGGQGIRFLGNRNDIPKLMKSFDVFALTSINEGISNTILEAMATGLPVVASRVGGNPELVVDGSTGLLFVSKNGGQLASNLLIYAKSEHLRKDHGCKGRQRVEEKFSIQAMVAQYETVWRRVAHL